MRPIPKAISLSATLLVLASCAAIETAQKTAIADPVPVEIVAARDYRVTALEIVVPRDLTVSEAHLYYPQTDIVWRGDPPGDRYAQIEDILQAAAERGTGGLAGNRPVRVAIQLTRFHAVTQKARWSVGGVHSVHFRMAVYDADTGAVIEPVREIIADLEAFGGFRALEAEREGRTQKVRISGHLAGVIQRELVPPITQDLPLPG